MEEIKIRENQSFEDIKHIDEAGNEYWLARELQTALAYSQWRNFEKVIKIAKIACKISQQDPADHFAEVSKMVDIGSNTQRELKDYKLSRYACYLIVMNGDPRKKVIAEGQTYFAVKTRQQEFLELFDSLSEDDKRLFLRGDIKQKNMLLAESARNAGVITQTEFAIFQDSGYKGLYNGLTARDIANRKNLTPKDDILDFMGSEELGANLFRITQTEGILRKNNISSAEEANRTHYKVGKAIRGTIESLGGTMPEDLPTPTESIKQIENKKYKKLQKNA